jgi:hypothetical protein
MLRVVLNRTVQVAANRCKGAQFTRGRSEDKRRTRAVLEVRSLTRCWFCKVFQDNAFRLDF